MNRVHAHTKIHNRVKYEQDTLNMVGCRVVTKAGAKHQSVSVLITFQSATES